MFDIEDIAEELEMLQTKASNWEACIEAAQRHPDWNPANPEAAIAVISGFVEGWRVE